MEALTKRAIRVVDTKQFGKKAVANVALQRGQVINRYNAPVFSSPTMHTVCLTESIHVAPTFGAECISHACGVDIPNTAMKVVGSEVQVVVTRDVSEGQDLFFNYNTTEWTMSCPFDCLCPHCTSPGRSSKRVQGFSKLSPCDQDELLPHASPFVKSLLQQLRQRQSPVTATASAQKQLAEVAKE